MPSLAIAAEIRWVTHRTEARGQAGGGCLGCVPYWQTMRRRRRPTAHAVFQDRPTFRRTPCRKHSLAGGPAAARTDGGRALARTRPANTFATQAHRCAVNDGGGDGGRPMGPVRGFGGPFACIRRTPAFSCGRRSTRRERPTSSPKGEPHGREPPSPPVCCNALFGNAPENARARDHLGGAPHHAGPGSRRPARRARQSEVALRLLYSPDCETRAAANRDEEQDAPRPRDSRDRQHHDEHRHPEVKGA
jgi:hypothetical protein